MDLAATPLVDVLVSAAVVGERLRIRYWTASRDEVTERTRSSTNTASGVISSLKAQAARRFHAAAMAAPRSDRCCGNMS